MSVEVKGVDKLVKQLERKFGSNKMREIEDVALNEGADVVVKGLKKNFESFKDTGASINEIVKTKPYSTNSRYARSIMIKWEGPMNRKNIIHLNEHGYTRDGKNYTPKGFGVIAKTLTASKAPYRKVIIRELRRRT
ncbi:hypothetical protein [Staphylococcus intermedius]|uniref:hypothetical protein n=1 Tax=Staphylococcus intermedius TaxID=1285 RepID=UPI000BBBA290|nr:hypothetical protein [Staphylococcus intermedius]PCF86393.1 hypothetical protein B4W75_10585 [Staphylococcus intermedius]